MDGLDEVDCNIYIPNLNDLKMDGETILVPAHVQKVLDELAKSKRQGVDLNYSDDVVFVLTLCLGRLRCQIHLRKTNKMQKVKILILFPSHYIVLAKDTSTNNVLNYSTCSMQLAWQ